MKTYEESLEWVAREAPDASMTCLCLVAFIYGTRGQQLADDYQAAKRMVRIRERIKVVEGHE